MTRRRKALIESGQLDLKRIVEELVSEAQTAAYGFDLHRCSVCGGVVERHRSGGMCTRCASGLDTGPAAPPAEPRRMGGKPKRRRRSGSRMDAHAASHSRHHDATAKASQSGTSELEALAEAALVDLYATAVLHELADEASHPRTGSPPPPPGDCSPARHADLQRRVKLACDVTTPWGTSVQRSCDGITKCNVIKQRGELNKRCAAARWAVNHACFRGGDRTHRSQAFAAARSANECRRRFEARGCRARSRRPGRRGFFE